LSVDNAPKERALFNDVIVGVDRPRAGRDGILLAERLMARGGTRTLACVLTSDPLFYRGASQAVAEAERAEAIDLLETARDLAGVQAHLRCEWWPSVGRGLHEIAEELGGDLVVVGSSSRGVLGRVLIGDDTHASLNGARCAVAIAPAGYGEASGPIREVGVGYDGSAESEAALELARAIAREQGARLSACQAVSIPTTALGPGPLPLGDTMARLVREAQERLDGLEDVDARAAYGSPAGVLAVYSGSVDLLIVGSRGYGPVGRLVHGSTSSRLARSACCPLLVLPRSPVPSTSRTAQSDEASVAMSGR
jgi:nucleotide-binding universal stress UspA family protein